LETYHMLLSSITAILYEQLIWVDSKLVEVLP
jgi:hypothetical protein